MFTGEAYKLISPVIGFIVMAVLLLIGINLFFSITSGLSAYFLCDIIGNVKNKREMQERPLKIKAFDHIQSAEPAIEDARKFGCDVSEAKEMLNKAIAGFDSRNYEEAISDASKSENHALKIKKNANVARDRIKSAEPAIEDARKFGCDVSEPKELLSKAITGYESGNYKEAISDASRSKNLAIEITKARHCLKSAEPTIEDARKFGCNVSEPKELLNKAIAGYESGNYEEAISDASRSEEVAIEIRNSANPEIELNLSKNEFQVGIWEKILVGVLNKGNAHAKDIEIEFKRAEVEGLEIIKTLGVGDKRDFNVDFKSKYAGSVPLNIDIRFEDFDGKKYEDMKTVNINVKEVKEEEKYEIPIEKKIEIKRGYEVLQNNDLRFGIRVINETDYIIADVEAILDYPKTLFSMKDNEIQTLANIHPNGKRTAKYILTPLGCIHNEKIGATIIYKDHTGEKHAVQMHSKEVHCVCPFLSEKAMREGEFAELANACERIEEGLSFSGISVNEIAEFIKEACAHRLYVIGEHEIENAKIVYLAGESIGEKACYLLTAVIQPYKNLTQIALRAYSDKPYGLHGFLNEIANSIRHLVGSVQSAKEIGIIENKQVITIIDSVVQRTSFGGSREGETSVNIEGSVVQRTEIGAVRKCQNCEKEVQSDEKFCKECGAKLA